ncbi:MAG: NAD(P)-dependent glycerol-3-phosphate dehydrogenase [Deltaproteobacteria bacterium]
MKTDPAEACERTAVIGAGSWGTALAILIAEKGLPVTLWARDPKTADTLASDRENRKYLPGAPFPEQIRVTSDLGEAVSGSGIIVIAVPSHGFRKVAEAMAPHLDPSFHATCPKAVVSATKGIENDTLLFMTDVLAEVLSPRLSSRFAALSGPSFAKETVKSLPTAVTVAARDDAVCRLLQSHFSTKTFRVYTNRDLIGVQMAGALKNVLAIASGISDGMGFGHNTRAALITRGLAEMTRLGLALGANPLTFAGLAGLGDLVLTCTGDLSRNRTVGLRLGRGEHISDILAGMSMVAEGVMTSRSARDLAQKTGVDMPITEKVFEVLHRGKDPRDAVRELLARPHRQEYLDQAGFPPSD